MSRISEYKDLISNLPVEQQSSTIKKEIWKRIEYEGKSEIERKIFGNKDFIEISRNDIFAETNIRKKIIMILMWGYPTGGRGNNIQNLLMNINNIIDILKSINKKNLIEAEAREIINKLNSIIGLGMSTWTKFLYFFDVSIGSNKCQIFDLKIVASLNKKQFDEFEQKTWKQDIAFYLEYNKMLNEIAKTLEVSPDRIELFLFLFNLGFMFENIRNNQKL